MKYWWVNQTESAGHGLDAGCLWTQKKHHHKNADPFHEKICSVCIGDPLISCTNGRVVAVGTVLPKAYAAPNRLTLARSIRVARTAVGAWM